MYGSPEAISSANMGSSDTRVLRTSRIACLFLSAADDLRTVTVDISVSCRPLSMDAMLPTMLLDDLFGCNSDREKKVCKLKMLCINGFLCYSCLEYVERVHRYDKCVV